MSTASSTTSSDKTIRILPFDGSSQGWHMWSRRFRAKCKVNGTSHILDGKSTVASDDKTNLTAEEVEDRKANDSLYVELLLSCEDPVCFGIVDNAKTTALKEGDAKEAWSGLLSKYESSSEASKCQPSRSFTPRDCLLYTSPSPRDRG